MRSVGGAAEGSCTLALTIGDRVEMKLQLGGSCGWIVARASGDGAKKDTHAVGELMDQHVGPTSITPGTRMNDQAWTLTGAAGA